MTITKDQLLASLAKFNRSQISSAGARYTPGIDPDAPNIVNEELFRALHHLACGAEVEQALEELSNNLGEGWKRSISSCESPELIEASLTAVQSYLKVSAEKLRGGEEAAYSQLLAALKDLDDKFGREQSRLRQLEQEAFDRARKHASADGQASSDYSPEANAIRSKLHDIRRTSSLVSRALEIYDSPTGRLLVARRTLLRGQWGTGKTHLLCDVTAQRLAAGRPVLLVLAKNFQSPHGTLQTLAQAVGSAPSSHELLTQLNELGKLCNERVLILIDGINEGPRAAWRAAIDELAAIIAQRRNLALLVSCRSPFEDLALSDRFKSDLVVLDHRGFDEQEFDAQAEFFRYHKVPLPEVPPLNEEFSRPLTLKLICEAFHDLQTSKQSKGFAGIASGQKGMTFVLETFVSRIGKKVEQDFSLPPKACWMLLKGGQGIADPRHAGFAPSMAATLRGYVPQRSALRIIAAQFPNLSRAKRAELLEALRINGLIDEDLIWRRVAGGKAKSQVVYRLPYQRFSDHLIARHLLDAHLDKTSVAAVKQSFAARRPLGRVFGRRKHRWGYASPGWAEALMVEFPEYVKRLAPSNTRELYFFLPRRAQRLGDYYKPFLQGLFWRSPASFSQGTGRVMGALLDDEYPEAWRETMDALVAIAIKPSHPYSADALYKYLARLDMPSRDLLWGEYIRKAYHSPSIRRLLHWVESAERINVPSSVAVELFVLLSLVLTTVRRRDRDVATRALVVIGEQYPLYLFAHTLRALEFNDPYVRERMLAACYGVAMSLWAAPKNAAFQKAFRSTAKDLYREMFARGAPHATSHVLSRDYALGFIHLALRLDPTLLGEAERRDVTPPFTNIPSPFPPPPSISDVDCEDGKSAIHMDFGNYTIGRLVPNRSNYDSEQPTYKEIVRQIEWRIGNLGYRQATFKEIDQEIGRDRFHGEQEGRPKVDRYGKKYSWIAYFEMYGVREAQRLLADYRLEERVSDADIDPSFPKPPPAWQPPLPEVFGDSRLSAEDWLRRGETPDFTSLLHVQEINGVAGPWTLLDGYVSVENGALNREVFTFLRGLFLARRNVDELRKRFLEIEYPGNHAIPDGGRDYYLYAGEAATGYRYAAHLRQKNGSFRRQIAEAFALSEPIPSSDKDSGPELPAITVKAPPKGSESNGSQTPPGDDGDLEDTLRMYFAGQPRYRHIPGIDVEIPGARVCLGVLPQRNKSVLRLHYPGSEDGANARATHMAPGAGFPRRERQPRNALQRSWRRISGQPAPPVLPT